MNKRIYKKCITCEHYIDWFCCKKKYFIWEDELKKYDFNNCKFFKAKK